MKKVSCLCLLFFSILLLPSFTPDDGGKLKIPKKVNAIFQNKCYGCHNTESKGKKASDKLNWDNLATLAPEEQLAKMKSIQEVLKEGAMPPGRFLEKNPDKKLTDKETATLKKWADKAVKKLSK